MVFTGDTLFPGGPGATVPPLGDFATIIESIRTHLVPLEPRFIVYPGHGDSTTIAEAASSLEQWAGRRW
jgi:glyoxylase-like metal-dependent hydrolase (beta-lactamase superfamily II)